jgi:hypothetical protein
MIVHLRLEKRGFSGAFGHVLRVLVACMLSALAACSSKPDGDDTGGLHASGATGGKGAVLGSGGRSAGGAANGAIGGMTTGGASGSTMMGPNPSCIAPQIACGSACIDPTTDIAHCGNCTTACGSGQTCTSGKCACPNGGLACGSACVDGTSDHEHCGDCSKACGMTQTCTAGTCTCPGGQTACGDACVDTQTNDDNCGSCAVQCNGGRSCEAGMCACPGAQEFCAGSCADTTTSTAHCGACGMACAVGQTCTGGKCAGVGGGGADGCTGGVALNVALSRVDAFQTIQIGIMKDGKEIATTARNTDVVEARETVFRIFVTPGSGWAARELSARVTAVNGATNDEYFAKKTVSAASVETDETSTFQVTVPADKITVDTHYKVELVECSMSATGAAGSPRFPATDDIALGARKVGPLKIKVIPLVVNNRTPAVDAATLGPFKDIMVAMYPASSVEVTAGDPVTLGTLDWNSSLNQVQSKRQTDKPAADVYYYGVVTPADTFQQYCGNGCTAGVGFVVGQANDSQHKVAMGIGFPMEQSYITMAHEVGHNHGRSHAPCVPQGGSISGVDSNFPYDSAKITLWGYDSRSKKLINPTGEPNKNDDVTDIMGYCNRQWMSDYTYDAIVNRVASVNGAQKVLVNPDVLGRWRTLLLDGHGPRWGIPVDELAPPSGTAEVAEILDAKGNVIASVAVYRTEVSDIGAAQIMVPEPKPGWHAVRISGERAHAFSEPSVVKKPP